MNIVEAAASGNLEQVRLYLEHGVHADEKQMDLTALMRASQHGHLEIVQLLIKYGANVNVDSDKFKTSLMAASFKNHFKVVETLIQHGADVNLTDNRKITALGNALYRKNYNIALLFHKYGHLLENKERQSLHELFRRCRFGIRI